MIENWGKRNIWGSNRIFYSRFFFTGCVFSLLCVCVFPPLSLSSGREKKTKTVEKKQTPSREKRTQGGNTHTHIQDRKNKRVEKN